MYIDHRKLLAANTRTYERFQSLSSDARGSLDYIDLPESCFDHVTYVKSTLYSDLYKATCRLESRGRGTIAIKRLRVSKKEDLASVSRLPPDMTFVENVMLLRYLLTKYHRGRNLITQTFLLYSATHSIPLGAP